MTQPAYRNDRPGPHCGSSRTTQHGASRGKQTGRCQQCFYRFTPDGNRHYYPETIKVQALRMYTDGISIAAIGRSLQIKTGTVGSWGKKARSNEPTRQVARQRRSRRAPQQPRPRVISFDEMWPSVGSRRRGRRRYTEATLMRCIGRGSWTRNRCRIRSPMEMRRGGVLAPESIIQRAASFDDGTNPASDHRAFGAS